MHRVELAAYLALLFSTCRGVGIFSCLSDGYFLFFKIRYDGTLGQPHHKKIEISKIPKVSMQSRVNNLQALTKCLKIKREEECAKSKGISEFGMHEQIDVSSILARTFPLKLTLR